MLSATRSFRRLQGNHASRKNLSFFSNILDGRFFQVPKGFEKYLPKRNNRVSGGSRSGDAAKDSAPKGAGKQTGGGSSGGGGPENPFKSSGSGGGKSGDSDTQKSLFLIAATAGALGLSLLVSKQPTKEISWQEFESSVLPSGTVERIDVVNKTTAYVVRKLDSAHSSEAADPVPDWAREPAPYSNDDPEASKDPYDVGGKSATGERSQSKAIIDSKLLRISRRELPETFKIGSVESFERKLDEAQKNLQMSPAQRIPVFYTDEVDWGEQLINFAPLLLMMGGIAFMMSSGGPAGQQMRGAMGMMKSRAIKADKAAMTIRFKDVAGCDEAKKEIMEFVDFLKDHKKYTDLGAKIPKGALLVGPPGTGKTLLAKATAGEANVPFFSVSGSDFTEMFVGVGAGRVRDLFKEARENAPCIVFIDEIDAVGGKRGKNMMGGNSEKENTLNQLLVEMDGFTARDNIVVLAGTNRSDVLDPALLRPGRFDRQVQVDKPDINGRKEIFEVYLRKLTLKDAVEDLSPRLAALTPGFAGADIANICNEAAIVAARKDKKFVDIVDFEAATDRVIAGLESHKLISPEEKRVVAYHEAGHAVAGWFLEYADPLLKVTIIPRSGGSLGFAQYLPKELFLRTKEQMLDIVCMAMAGRASEQINFGKVTSGAADDLRRTTQIIYQMVQIYGMNSRVGQVSFPPQENAFGGQDRLYSEATAEMMDEEVREIVAEAYQRTLDLIESKKEEVRLVAELLLKQETISHTDIAKLIGDRPYSAGKEYDQFVAHMKENPIPSSGQDGSSNEGEHGAPPPPPGDDSVVVATAHAHEAAVSEQGSSEVTEKGETNTSRIMKEINKIVRMASGNSPTVA